MGGIQLVPPVIFGLVAIYATNKLIKYHLLPIAVSACPAVEPEEVSMTDALSLKPKGLVRGRAFAKARRTAPPAAGPVHETRKRLPLRCCSRRLKVMEAELPGRSKEALEIFGAGNPRNSIYWEDLALDSA
jgi:hypothetical protein